LVAHTRTITVTSGILPDACRMSSAARLGDRRSRRRRGLHARGATTSAACLNAMLDFKIGAWRQYDGKLQGDERASRWRADHDRGTLGLDCRQAVRLWSTVGPTYLEGTIVREGRGDDSRNRPALATW